MKGFTHDIAECRADQKTARDVCLNQPILNLVVNAAHAVGAVQRAEECPAPGCLALAPSRAPGQVGIRVSDGGTGAPGGIRAQIFDPFLTIEEVGRRLPGSPPPTRRRAAS